MKFGLFAPTANPFATPEFLRMLGREADERGVDSLWFPEHVVLFDDHDSFYPYADDGSLPIPAGSGLLDPINVMTFMAGCTERVRLGSGICLLPQRNPVYAAKEVATADWLSNGRIDFGVGIGWLKEEFEAVGVSWEGRGHRTDEYIRILRTLWSDGVASFDGEFYKLPACRQDPKPVQKPGVPVIIGGESDPALRRVLRVGDGWLGFNHTSESAAERIARLEEMADRQGQTLDGLEIKVSPYFNPLDEAELEKYAEMGVTEVVATFIALSSNDVGPMLDALQPLIERAHAL